MLKDDITICIYMSDYMAYVYTVHCQASLDVEYDVSPIRNGVPTPPTFPTCPVTMVTRDSMSNLFLGQHQRRHQIAPDVRGLEAGQESSVEFVHFVLAQGTVGSAQIHGQPLHVGHLGKAWSHGNDGNGHCTAYSLYGVLAVRRTRCKRSVPSDVSRYTRICTQRYTRIYMRV